LILRRRALQALRDIVRPFAEILPVTIDGDEAWALNVRSVGALDETRSRLLRFPDSGRIMRVTRPYFVKARIAGVSIFRLPFRASPTYVARQFVEAVDAEKLEGLRFSEIEVVLE
jgi:hypothetical protein